MAIKELSSKLGEIMRSPHIGFGSVVAGIVAISQSAEDFNVLFGPHTGPKIYVLAKWFGAFCMGVAGAANSVIPKKEAE